LFPLESIVVLGSLVVKVEGDLVLPLGTIVNSVKGIMRGKAVPKMSATKSTSEAWKTGINLIHAQHD
jgi:hypothetical protein